MKNHNLRQILFEITALAILCAQFASAEVLIHQVLYDPFQESGSEAVELVNTDNTIIDISGWQVESDQFSPDATLSNGSLIEPAGFFLIADRNWSLQKDNKDWPNADYEEAITLKNNVGGVALKNSQGQVIDSLSWGAEANKFTQGSPSQNTKEGQSLMRVNTSKNNSNDFKTVIPVFAGKQNAVMLLEVMLPRVSILNAFFLEDDELRSGVQFMPATGATREVIVRNVVQHGTPVFEFLNTSTEMTLINNNTWEVTLQLPYFISPGNKTAFVRSGSEIQLLSFEILANKVWHVEPRKTMRSAIQGDTILQEFELFNKGNVGVNLSIFDMVLQGEKTNLKGNVAQHNVQLLPAQQAIVQASISVPSEVSGMFSGMLDIQETGP